LLGGKCNGAMVAFEAARELMAAGHKVHMVAMVDPPTVSARPALRAILGRMKPLVSPYHLRWTYELMARLERFFSASRSERIAMLYDALSNADANPYPNKEIPAVLWDAYSNRNGAISSGTARGACDLLRGRPERSSVAASLFSTRSDPGAWG